MLRRMVLSASVAVACAGCGWVIPDDRDVPDQVRTQFERVMRDLPPIPENDCEVQLDRIRLVATAEREANAIAPMQWYMAPTDDGGWWELTIRLDDEGRVVGGGSGAGGCGDAADRDDGLWWSGGSGSDNEVVHGGHAPDGSRTVRLTFAGHDPVTVKVNSEGYFLVVLRQSACCEWSSPDLLEALDAGGNVVASTNRP